MKHINKGSEKRCTKRLKSTVILVLIMGIATLISLLVRWWGLHESNFIMIYLLGVIVVANLTDGYTYSIGASFIGVLTFNYFFTVPYYSLQAYRADYPVTFVVMLLVALITSSLTTRLKTSNKHLEHREKRLQILYRIIRKLLAANTIKQIALEAAGDIKQFLDASVFVAVADIEGSLSIKIHDGVYLFDNKNDILAYKETYTSGNACGHGTSLFSDAPAYYFPICGQSGILGVIGIHTLDKNVLSDGMRVFLDTFGSQVALALERERLYVKQEKNKVEIAKEHLRGNLLRALSHDLRTPLTGILGSVDTLLENENEIPPEIRKSFLQDIADEAQWLNQLVENTLNMTRIEDGCIQLHKELLPIEEIVGSAVNRVKKRSAKAIFHLNIPSEFIMIPVDGILMEQVLVNLLDNAIKYSVNIPEITIAVSIQGKEAIFEIADNGTGISPEDLDKVFDRFYTAEQNSEKRKKGIGLGLYICKEIIIAHGGTIVAENRPEGGAVFTLTLPAKED